MAKTKSITVEIDSYDYGILDRRARFHERTMEQEVRWLLKCAARARNENPEISITLPDDETEETD